MAYKNREEYLAYQKEYRTKNREALLEQKRLHRLANLKEHRERERQSYQKRKEKISAQKREYYLKNKEKINRKSKEYFAKNPHKILEYSHRRRAAVKNNGFEKYTLQEALDLYGTNCFICGKEIDLSASRLVGKPGWENGLHLDHVIPILEGGPDTLFNVRPTHGKCNLVKGSKIISSAQSQAVNKR